MTSASGIEREERREHSKSDVLHDLGLERAREDEVDRAEPEHREESPSQQARLLLQDRIGRSAQPVGLRGDSHERNEKAEEHGEERLTGMARAGAVQDHPGQHERDEAVSDSQQPAVSRLDGKEPTVGEDHDGVHVREARQQMEQIVREPVVADEVVAHRAMALMIEQRGGTDHRDREQPGGAIAGAAHDQQETQAQVQRTEQRLQRYSGAVVSSMRCVGHPAGHPGPALDIDPLESILALGHTGSTPTPCRRRRSGSPPPGRARRPM